MTTLRAPLKPTGTARQGWGITSRLDNWASTPTLQAFVFTICASYLTFSGIIWNPLFNTPYEVDGYLSPLFSPLIVWPDMPWWLSPGLLILWIPIGFRATCYYYRKAYYRFYFSDPPGCAVGEPRVLKHFSTENALPFILQNIHRYFLYLAFIPLAFLWLDLVPAFIAPADEGVADPGPRIGFVGILFLVNVVLLTGYSLSCHSLRHLVGGKVDCFSCTRRQRARYEAWRWLSFLNRSHMQFAWASLITVTLADLVVRLMALGVLSDVVLLRF